MAKEIKNNHPAGQQPVEKKEFTGRSLEDVLSLAEHVLKAAREELDYEIVTEKTRLFGLKNKEIVIRAWPRQVNEINLVDNFLKQLLSLLPFNLTFEVKKREQLVYVIFGGEDKHWLLKDDGALLLAIQHLLNKISPVKVQADCEFFAPERKTAQGICS